MPKVFDLFPFFNELDVLEIRLNELDPMVDVFLISESKQTYGGDIKPLYLADAILADPGRFAKFWPKMCIISFPWLEPEIPAGAGKAERRMLGRAREEFQRNAMINSLRTHFPKPEDVIIFSDCDEIPRCETVEEIIPYLASKGIHRLKQRSYYYNVNTLIDYGRDICSRARVGTWAQLQAAGSLYMFRMWGKNDESLPAVEEGGWHFSYFGGDLDLIETKVAAVAPFLEEYKLFGVQQLAWDIAGRRDLHHRHKNFSQLPDKFEWAEKDDPRLPEFYLQNLDRFKHFTAEFFFSKYEKLLAAGSLAGLGLEKRG